MLPFIYGGIVLAGLFFGTKGFGGWGNRKGRLTKKYLAILGLSGSGKTRLQYYFRNKPYEEGESITDFMGEELGEVRIEEGNKTVIIKKGHDIQGTTLGLKEYTESEIGKSDLIFFLFDIRNVDGEDERAELLGYLEYVLRTNTSSKKIVLIGTHCDESKEFNDSRNFQNKIERIFFSFIQENYPDTKSCIGEILFVSLKDQSNLKMIKKKLFK